MPNEAVAWLSCASLSEGGNRVSEVNCNWLGMMYHATYGHTRYREVGEERGCAADFLPAT